LRCYQPLWLALFGHCQQNNGAQTKQKVANKNHQTSPIRVLYN
jgi:hypothetical protein